MENMSSENPRKPEFPINPSLAYKLGGVLLLLVILNQAVGIFVETLWFESVGYESVYWFQLTMQLGAFCLFSVLTFLILWCLLRAVSPAIGESRSTIEFSGETIVIPPLHFFRRIIVLGAAFFSLMFGLRQSIAWPVYLLFLNRPETQGSIDPILGRELNFYLFVVPMLDVLTQWAISIALIVGFAGVCFGVLDSTMKFRGVSLGLTLVALVLAFKAYLYQFQLMFKQNALFSGITYVDEHAIIPGLYIIAAALLLAAAISAYNVFACRPRNLLVAAIIPSVAYLFAGVLVPGYVSNFVVRPNELVRETPYIKNNIESTRRAFGLDSVEEIRFDPGEGDTSIDVSMHHETLDNVRLWDWRALQATLGQVQEIRTYYDFVDVDVDRYEIDGKKKAMMLATRELSLGNLPAGSSNWINENLIFTHGYGVTMNPVNRFTSEGLPEFILHDMPVETTVPELKVTRPEVYYGELTNWPVYVKTKQKEFNYPEGESNNYSIYEGTSGIPIGGFFRRLLLSYEIGEIATLPFADDITSESELLMRRNIRQRVQTIAPFLMYDDDAYIVVGEDGGLYWIIDAFTVSNTYPYSKEIAFGRRNVNYIRNSVKVIINAYNGSTKFYVFEEKDPIIQAYRNIFPALFLDAKEMPEWLRPHTRYPELLFRIQALVYAKYHVEDEQVFYNQEDLWSVAQQGRSQAGSDEIDPYFVLLRFPGNDDVEFVSILPFTPQNRNNLIGWMAARSDGEAYGKLRAYQFPKTRFIDGPLQIEARIDQDPELSSQLSLWNQQGSTVLRGNLLVIPLDRTLLFVAPIYLQAERSPMPELRIVVLATQDRMVYGATYEEALQRMLGGVSLSPSLDSLTKRENENGSMGTNFSSSKEGREVLILRAAEALAAYQNLTAKGDLADAGRALEELKEILSNLAERQE